MTAGREPAVGDGRSRRGVPSAPSIAENSPKVKPQTPSKPFLTEVRGFTPVIDVLVEELGLIPAVVYGQVWRYTQMSDGVCKAPVQKIGARIGLSERTTRRHIKRLCAQGYLQDLTPNQRNCPHVYADTGKLKILGLIEAVKSDEVGQEVTPTPRYDRESDLGMTESQTEVGQKVRPRYDRESDEDSLLRDFKDSSEDTAAAATPKSEKNFVLALEQYEAAFGPLGEADRVKFAMTWEEHPVIERHNYALRETLKAERPNLLYYGKCLTTAARSPDADAGEQLTDEERTRRYRGEPGSLQAQVVMT